VGEENKIHREIGKIKVPITGVGINQECKVEASCCNNDRAAIDKKQLEVVASYSLGPNFVVYPRSP